MRKDAAGRDSSPLELMILGALRYLGRGWTFDDIEEKTAVSEETHRSFLHDFIICGSTILFRNHVESLQPSTATEAQQHMHEYSVARVLGAIGSTDTTHMCLMVIEIFLLLDFLHVASTSHLFIDCK
jgi:hypothetical protein